MYVVLVGGIALDNQPESGIARTVLHRSVESTMADHRSSDLQPGEDRHQIRSLGPLSKSEPRP